MGGKTIGFYDMSQADGNEGTQVTSITVGGHTAVDIHDLSVAELSGLDVLVIQNPNNSIYNAEFLNALPDIQAAVANGLVLIIHDRATGLANAAGILPGGAGIQFFRDTETNDVELVDDLHPIANGPGGIVTDFSLDGGNSSFHGYADASTLPVGAEVILSTPNVNQAVTFAYAFGAGQVVYSSIPLDHYLQGFGPAAVVAGMEAYIANLIDYFATPQLPPNYVTLTQFDDVYVGTDAQDIVLALDGDDILDGGLGNDILHGNAGNDTFIGSSGGDFFNGGIGAADRVQYTNADSGVRVDFSNPSSNTGQASGDTYSGIERLYGSQFNDVLSMGNGDDFIFGLDGNDILLGRDGADRLFGGSGDDSFFGGAGDDVMYGQAGSDIFIIELNAGNDVITDFTIGSDLIIYLLGPQVLNPQAPFEQLDIAQIGSTTYIAFETGVLTLYNVNAADLTAADFDFIYLPVATGNEEGSDVEYNGPSSTEDGFVETTAMDNSLVALSDINLANDDLAFSPDAPIEVLISDYGFDDVSFF